MFTLLHNWEYSFNLCDFYPLSTFNYLVNLFDKYGCDVNIIIIYVLFDSFIMLQLRLSLFLIFKLNCQGQHGNLNIILLVFCPVHDFFNNNFLITLWNLYRRKLPLSVFRRYCIRAFELMADAFVFLQFKQPKNT